MEKDKVWMIVFLRKQLRFESFVLSVKVCLQFQLTWNCQLLLLLWVFTVPLDLKRDVHRTFSQNDVGLSLWGTLCYLFWVFASIITWWSIFHFESLANILQTFSEKWQKDKPKLIAEIRVSLKFHISKAPTARENAERNIISIFTFSSFFIRPNI